MERHIRKGIGCNGSATDAERLSEFLGKVMKMTLKQFKTKLKRTVRIVESWPEWKKAALDRIKVNFASPEDQGSGGGR